MERQFKEPRRQDPYRTKTKLSGTPRCPSCRGIFVHGKWYPEKEARRKLAKPFRLATLGTHTCPACLQLQDRYAMAVIEIHGDAWKTRRDAVKETILNTEKIARIRNDQQRILWSQTFRNVTKYYVTLPDLARQIGHVLGKTFKGKIEFHRSSEEPYLRVVWLSEKTGMRVPGRIAKSQQLRGRGYPLSARVKSKKNEE